MTKPELLDTCVVTQFRTHIDAIERGDHRRPLRAVLVEFYEGDKAWVQTYGMPPEANTREFLAQVLRGQMVMSDVATSLNASAAN